MRVEVEKDEVEETGEFPDGKALTLSHSLSVSRSGTMAAWLAGAPEIMFGRSK